VTGSFPAGVSATGTYSFSQSGGNDIYKFTGNGTITFTLGTTYTSSLTGSLSFSGSMTTSHIFAKALTAALTFTGSMHRLITKSMTAAVSFIGNWGFLYVLNVFNQWQLHRFDVKPRDEDQS
jgi:hypothetical protein